MKAMKSLLVRSLPLLIVLAVAIPAAFAIAMAGDVPVQDYSTPRATMNIPF